MGKKKRGRQSQTRGANAPDNQKQPATSKTSNNEIATKEIPKEEKEIQVVDAKMGELNISSDSDQTTPGLSESNADETSARKQSPPDKSMSDVSRKVRSQATYTSATIDTIKTDENPAIDKSQYSGQPISQSITGIGVRKKEPASTKKKTQSSVLISGAGGSVGSAKKQLEPPRAETQEKKKLGKSGRKIMVRANHFEMKVNIPDGTIYHYDVDFKFPWKREVRKSDRPLLIGVIEALKSKAEYRNSVFVNPFSVVFDGFKNIYTTHKLFSSGKFEGNVAVQELDSEREIDVKVTMIYVGSVHVKNAIEQYTRCGTTATRPNDSMQALNIVLGMTPQLHYETVGRQHFNLAREGSVIDLGQGKSVWVGTFQSVRLGWKPMLNVEMANKVAYEQCPVLTFVEKVLTSSRGPKPNEQQFELRRDNDFRKVEEALKGLKVLFYRPDGQKRGYTVNKLMEPANKLKIKLDNGQVVTIEQYFKTQYQYQLKHPRYPCLHVGKSTSTIYLPMERCDIKRQHAPRSKRLTEEEASNMIRKTALPPALKQKKIIENLQELNNNFRDDPYAKAFGITVSDRMITIAARVLDPPSLRYKNQQDAVIEFKKTEGGKWNMGSERDKEKFKFVKGMSLDRWGILDLASMRDREKETFVECLYNEGSSRGLNIDFPCYGRADCNKLASVESEFKNLYNQIRTECNNAKPQLIMILVPYKGPYYACLKYIGDAIYQIPTQFIMKKNVMGRDGRPSPQTLHNICLKLNSKLEGVNQALHSKPALLKVPVMIMGADVTHPAPGEQARKPEEKIGQIAAKPEQKTNKTDEKPSKPSIAAVVGSCDPCASKYNTEVRLQYGGQIVEVIEKIEEMTCSLLKKFQEETKQKPVKIIFYRDGVSEGQFIDVLNRELSAIRRACITQLGGHEPQITFLVAQKRHKTRLFPVNERDGVGKMRNVPPGTVVDTVISHPTEYDFFLASHEGIQGTTRPTHYHLLWDDSNLSPDELQQLTFFLCYLYSRCERSVSYPAPTYYAHLAAFRAREHHNALLEKAKGKDVNPVDVERMEKLNLINYFI